jgi:hypothetical protein
MDFKKVLNQIEKVIPVYDPLIIKDKRFFREGWMTCCIAGLELDKDWFNEGRGHQHPKMTSYFKIKQIWGKVKYTRIEA